MKAYGGSTEDDEYQSSWSAPRDTLNVVYDNGARSLSALVPEGTGKAMAELINSGCSSTDLKRLGHYLVDVAHSQHTEEVLADPEGWQPERTFEED